MKMSGRNGKKDGETERVGVEIQPGSRGKNGAKGFHKHMATVILYS